MVALASSIASPLSVLIFIAHCHSIDFSCQKLYAILRCLPPANISPPPSLREYSIWNREYTFRERAQFSLRNNSVVKAHSGCSFNPHTKECSMSQSLLEMTKDLVLAQIEAHSLSPEDMQTALQHTYSSLLALQA